MDNYFKQCPPMMADGRLFTDFRTATRREEYNKFVNNITRDDEYRAFLQLNAKTILDAEWQYTKDRKSCWVNKCIHNYPTRVHPGWFVEERRNYNILETPLANNQFPCSHYKDYRTTCTSTK